MKNTFRLISFFLVISFLLFQCSENQQQVSALATQPNDLIADSDSANFWVTVKGQNVKDVVNPDRFLNGVKVKLFRTGETPFEYTTEGAGKVSLPALKDNDELVFSHVSFHSIRYIIEDLGALRELNVYLKYKTDEDEEDKYVLGKTLNTKGTAKPDVKVKRLIMFPREVASGNEGNYEMDILFGGDIRLKYLTPIGTSCILKLETVKDTVQLDVFLDDNPILDID